MKQADSVKTYCRICESACGLLVERDERGVPLRIRPDREHPSSKGFVCAKGTRFLDVARHPDRLVRPMRRKDDGTLEAIAWEAALRLAGEKLRGIRDRYGPHSIGVYFGNPLAFNAFGVAALPVFARALGTRNVYSAGSQDCGNKFTGAEIVHGSALIHPIPDLANAELAVFFGSNPAVSQSSFVHLEQGSLAFDRLIERGGRVVWVDPRETESARRWGRHLAIRPGTDVFLLLSMVHLLRAGADRSVSVEGLHQLCELAARFPPERAETITGVPAADIR
ncbi:MAG: molybdopterin-dependent oxidoreductase, partial [Polyangiaceae bacterium]|nr:molybdopterin-dependent oxidoreductase [Polyangiaceae bacterium]